MLFLKNTYDRAEMSSGLQLGSCVLVVFSLHHYTDLEHWLLLDGLRPNYGLTNLWHQQNERVGI